MCFKSNQAQGDLQTKKNEKSLGRSGAHKKEAAEKNKKQEKIFFQVRRRIFFRSRTVI